MLETELQRVQDNAAQRERDLLQAVTELRADNERQQKLIGKVGVKVMSSKDVGKGHHCLGFLLNLHNSFSNMSLRPVLCSFSSTFRLRWHSFVKGGVIVTY